MSKARKIRELSYTVDEAARILKTSQHEIFKSIHNGELSSFKMGKSVRIPIGGIEGKLNETSETPA